MTHTSRYNKYIHKTSRGRWVVAEYDKALELYTAPMDARERRRTGLRAKSADSPDGLESISYSNRASALRRAERAYGAREPIHTATKFRRTQL
jgi:hypothetical protein